mmetsp:Transcript_93092/g.260330  ORF Transcript_93092/g.260330 Transcript_93092/m.260330 type:complete len:187 (-) Transcript_93092:85-645(-)|eukprot:CAMPEP_0176226100 /NCGR_PEP_ID=MMETSP0121_2-20121125/22092_1 /TAXON_ID=160619 /ORGANISM="Kryptoperidinium foliaceum, Strain CCMP 1326" /LENGTH=186 /DNA_ID=CAMNT_0017565367 /DNA_START=60 /DNA_END=620 /DNA_ORIENTATION=-
MPARPDTLQETSDAHVNVLSVEDAIALLQRATAGETKVEIVDVRSDDEFAGGYIAGAQHVPFADILESSAAEAKAAELLETLSATGADAILVHCMYSQGRGPAVARSLATLVEAKGLQLEVDIIDGGFHSFLNKVHGDGEPAPLPAGGLGDLVSGFKPDRWRRTPTCGLVEVDAVEAAKELGLLDT